MLRFRHHPTHLNLDQALEITEQNQSQTDIFYPHDALRGTRKSRQSELPKNVNLAFDGLRMSTSASHQGSTTTTCPGARH